MPIEATNDLTTKMPELTVDASGHEILSKELPKVDPSGRPYVEPELSEQQPIETTPPTQEEATSNEAAARKLFLQAQKAERRAKEMEKKASGNLAKVEAFEKAKQLAESGEDPTALLQAAGLDPVKFYKDMTTYALSDKNKQEDPVQKQLREQKETIERYAKEKEEFEKKITTERELQQHNSVISSTVIPLLQNNPERYELLLDEYGPDAAVTVYRAVWEAYNLPDDQKPEGWKMPTFEEAADRIEEYWYEKRKSAIIHASKKKKFQELFGSKETSSKDTTISGQFETPKRSQTLSNKQVISPATETYNRYLSREDRARAILKKFE